MDRAKPISFQEFIRGRVCRGDQARLDYDDYFNDFYKGEEEEDEVLGSVI